MSGGHIAAVLLACAGAALAADAPQGAATLTDYPGGKWAPGPARFGTVADQDLPVAADDGVILNAIVYYPADLKTGKRAEGKFPVVVEHTIYAVSPNNPQLKMLTEHGYIYAVVSARGTWKSGGELQAFTARDGMDGRAIIDWAAHRLSGSDGRVAVVGCSWPGVLAITDAAFAGPKSPVKAVIDACSGFDVVQRESWLQNGVLSARFPWPRANSGGPAPVDGARTQRVLQEWGAQILAGGDPAYDGAFWKDRQPISWARKIVENDIPVLQWAGWRDPSGLSVIRTFTALQNASQNRPLESPMRVGQPTTPKYQAIVGDWNHGGGLDPGVYLEWLETWVNGVDTGLLDTAKPLHLFETGTSRWVNVAGFPIVSKATRWKLGSGGEMKTGSPASAGGYKLQFGDPDRAGGRLVFQTPDLAKGATIAGPMTATIYARSNNTNMMLIAKLFDVGPDGAKELISNGVALGSQIDPDPAGTWKDAAGATIWAWPKQDKDKYLIPGSVYKVDIALNPRMRGVAPNHRLQFELTTQTPLDVCPADGPPARQTLEPCGMTAPQRKTLPGGVYDILYGPKWPSALNLPQLPYKALPEARSSRMPVTNPDPATGRAREEIVLPLDWSR